MNPVNPWFTYRVAALKIFRKSFSKSFKFVLSIGICLASRCDTPRPSATPLREGMARQRFIDNQNDAAAHPLSERGARSAGCVALSSIYIPRGGAHHQTPTIPGCVALSNWISVGSGQSVVLLRGRFAQNFNKIFFKIIQIRHNEGKALQKCRFCAVSTSLVVRLLSARCPVVVQSMTGQQLDNNWTTTGQRAKEVL